MPAPYLLIHGLIGHLGYLPPLFATQGAQAYAPDLLGYGKWQEADPASITLPNQVAHLARWLDKRNIDRVKLVGHSVGGAIAMLFANAYPQRVVSLCNVEGNFSLADAFWSVSLAKMERTQVEVMLTGFMQNPEGWLAKIAIEPSASRRDTALRLLGHQPASTIQATARSVVEETARSSYLASVRKLFDGPIPIHLIAGQRSKDDWHIPDWARELAASITHLPGGHLMMVENPASFVAAVMAAGERER